MTFWQEVQRLEHQTLKTLDRSNPFHIVRVTEHVVIVKPQETGIERRIQRGRLENSFRELVAIGELSRSEIEDKHSPRNPAYIAAILAEMPGVRLSLRPITLHYSQDWINEVKEKGAGSDSTFVLASEIKAPKSKQVERPEPRSSISSNKEISIIVHALIRKIFSTHLDVLLMACQQRAKFEGWLKFELAVALQNHGDIQEVVLEGSYGDRGRTDIRFIYKEVVHFLEMKTSNVNWRVKGVENRTRPIKKNVDEIIEDIHKLREKATSGNGLAVFAFFPVPSRIWLNEKDKLNYHLYRIERECSLAPGSLLQEVDFFEVDKQFGVCTFVLEVCVKT